MFLVDLFVVIVLALILSSVFTWGFGWRHPARADAIGTSLLFLFLVLALAMWAGGGWFQMRGPLFHGSPWLGFLLIGVFVALIILAVTAPARTARSKKKAIVEARNEITAVTIFGAIFWLLIVGLLVVAVVSYLV